MEIMVTAKTKCNSSVTEETTRPNQPIPVASQHIISGRLIESCFVGMIKSLVYPVAIRLNLRIIGAPEAK
jgi:hypothetical protein